MSKIEDITPVLREVWRRRIHQQIRGYTADHDDQHTDGSIADAAACYASPNAPLKLWPWTNSPPDHRDHRSRLVDAAALCIAEIERLDRASPVPQTDHAKAIPTIGNNCEMPMPDGFSLVDDGRFCATDDPDCRHPECDCKLYRRRGDQ